MLWQGILLNPYIGPVFAKWRWPLDDTTLQLKVKWIMSRPVHIVIPQAPLAALIRHMSRLSVNVLPIADQQGKVIGLATEADIFKAILKPKSVLNIPASDQTPEIQSVSTTIVEHKIAQPIRARQPSVVPVWQADPQKQVTLVLGLNNGGILLADNIRPAQW